MTATLRRLSLLLALVVLPSTIFAHQLDEYLQSTLVAIEPADVRLKINLTPGADVAEQVLAVIDHDRDGVISTRESAAYIELLKRDLTVRLDERNIELKLAASNFPAPTELRSGDGIIQVEFAIPTSSLADGTHRLILENRHLPNISAYLFNAARPRSGSVQVTRQERNENQSVGVIEFTLQVPAKSTTTVGVVASLIALLVVVVAGVWQARKSLTAFDLSAGKRPRLERDLARV